MRRKIGTVALLLIVFSPLTTTAQSNDETLVVGLMLSVGGRYDNVRMCVGSPPGVPGGPALDVSFFFEIDAGKDADVLVAIPIARPLLFWLRFDMLQFEPTARLTFDEPIDDNKVLVFGPVLGLSMHYGPDYESDSEGEGRGPSFWALGPILGGYLGIDFARPGAVFNFQLGITPYVTPLFSVDDPADHRGIVVGGMLEGHFRFHP